MSKAKIRRKRATEIETPHIVQLAFGREFFAAFGGDVDAMREAWTDAKVREAVWSRYRQKTQHGKPWAAVAFGDKGRGGTVKTAADIQHSRSLHWEECNPEQARGAVQWAIDTGRIDQAAYDEHMTRLAPGASENGNPDEAGNRNN